MTSQTQDTWSETIFAGGGEMGALMRSHNWEQSSLGPVANWSQSLKTGIRIILVSRCPIFIWWGQDFINFYNDPYIPLLGKQHPQALGESASDIWSERWHSVRPFAEDVLYNGNPSGNEECLEIMERNGYREETYFTFAYSPIGTDDGSVGGIFCACTEDTRRVIDARRLRTLSELGAETGHAKSAHQACQISTDVLANNLKDIPFALIYLLDKDSHRFQLVSTTNLDIATTASPSAIELADTAADCWLLNSVLASGENLVIDDLIDRFGALPAGAWDESPKSAIVLPLTRQRQEILGFLIAGISPYRPLDDDYRGFFDLVATQVTTAIANTLAYGFKDEFLVTITHELQAPLASILAWTRLLQSQLLERTKVARALSTIERNAMTEAKLVKDLLDVSSLLSKKCLLHRQKVDLLLLVKAVVDTLQQTAVAKQIQIAEVLPDATCQVVVFGDRDRLQQVITNLLSNAIKFTPEQRGIEINLQCLESDAQIVITDTGMGIRSNFMPHVFDRFSQAQVPSHHSPGGVGIGLAIARHLVELHGGTIEVASEGEGRGATFTVKLPLV